jgi:hypothetical protein
MTTQPNPSVTSQPETSTIRGGCGGNPASKTITEGDPFLVAK